MSEADKMFEELGYKKFFENKDTVRYANENSTIIEFHNGVKSFGKSLFGITMPELKAINKKVEELGWN